MPDKPDDSGVQTWTGQPTPDKPTCADWGPVAFRGQRLQPTGRCATCGADSVGYFQPPQDTTTLIELCAAATCGKDHRFYAGDLNRAPAMPGHFEEVMHEGIGKDGAGVTLQSQRGLKGLLARARAGAGNAMHRLQRGIPDPPQALPRTTRAGVLGELGDGGLFGGMIDEPPLHPDDIDEAGRIREDADVYADEPEAAPDLMRWMRIKGEYEAHVPRQGLCGGKTRCLDIEEHDDECSPAAEVGLELAADMGYEVRKCQE